MVHINNGDHDDPHGFPKVDSEVSQINIHHDTAHIDIPPKMQEEIGKLEYIYQHFQDHEKVYEFDLQITTDPIHDTLYPQMNNNVEYRLFENVIDSYYLNSQIRDDFQCTKTCYTHDATAGTVYPNPPCTHRYNHISQKLNSLADSEQQHTLYTNEVDTSSFTTDTATQCAYNITSSDLDTEHSNDVHILTTTLAFTLTVNIKIETLLVMHTYSIMILIMVMHSFTKINTQHCYIKSYKTHIGVYMIQSQLKVIRYLQTWI